MSSLRNDGNLTPIPYTEVTVGGSLGSEIEAVGNNILELDLKRDFISPLISRRGGISTYVGVGKVVEAAAKFAAHPAADRMIKRKSELVKQVIATQQADGYIGAMAPSFRMWKVWDVHEMSYLARGLAVDWLLHGEEESLEAAQRLTSFMLERWLDKSTKDIGGEQLSYWLSATGFEELLALMASVDEDTRLRTVAYDIRQVDAWDEPIVLGRDELARGHVYAYLARCLAQHEFGRLGDGYALSASDRALGFLIRGGGMLVAGSAGVRECWDQTQTEVGEIAETCATAHLVYFFDSLYRLTGDSAHADVVERIIHNALPAAHSPDGRQIRYYTPLSGPRSYFGRPGYCCPGNLRRVVSDIPRLLYHTRGGDTVIVSQFTESTGKVRVSDTDVAITQKTIYPQGDRIDISVAPIGDAHFSLGLRIPRWCTSASISLNGEPASQVDPGDIHFIRRTWRRGDQVVVRLPMAWRLIAGRGQQRGRGALARGPLVYGLSGTSEDAAGVSLEALPEPPEIDRTLKANLLTNNGVTRSLELAPIAEPSVVMTHMHLDRKVEGSVSPDELLSGPREGAGTSR